MTKPSSKSSAVAALVLLATVARPQYSSALVPATGRVRSNVATIRTGRLWSANSEYPDYYDVLSSRTTHASMTSLETMDEVVPFGLEEDFHYHNNVNNREEEDESFDLQAQQEEDQRNRWKIQLTNSVLQILHNSFKNVEATANELLDEDPVTAFAVFVGAGLVAAYVLGLFILDGCMESWNPVQNGMVPYWDEEVLVMIKKVH
ncbi:expressed unknown protein [Seminavis robusta]|uniref:Uncharacterized protein n=1 Tax=Seminavis robusta TaxID=568900 RepID=A0A9N8F1Y6_9STRA|nr:expressed unknown protein [Seminavis robusta]|eukprot:Sro2346_g324230.1 n/a (204) ;mRNA; r:13436-14047